jgi:hypothetical protein
MEAFPYFIENNMDRRLVSLDHGLPLFLVEARSNSIASKKDRCTCLSCCFAWRALFYRMSQSVPLKLRYRPPSWPSASSRSSFIGFGESPRARLRPLLIYRFWETGEEPVEAAIAPAQTKDPASASAGGRTRRIASGPTPHKLLRSDCPVPGGCSPGHPRGAATTASGTIAARWRRPRA